MSARIERLRLLTDQLRTQLEKLSTATTSGSSAVFLDLLARCEAFLPYEQRASGAAEVIAEAQRQREQHGSELADWTAVGLNLLRLRDGAEDVLEAQGDSLAWAHECLLVASIVTSLRGAVARGAAELLEEAEAWTSAHPAAFRDLVEIANDRFLYERPDRMASPWPARLLATWRELPTLAQLDAEPFEAAPLPLTDPELAAADRDIAGPADDVVTLLRGYSTHDRLVLAASSGIPDHALLRRLPEGELLLVRAGGQLELQWYGMGEPSISVYGEPLPRRVESEVCRWTLVNTPGSIEVALGPLRFDLSLVDRHDHGLASAGAASRELATALDWNDFAPKSVATRLRHIAASPGATILVKKTAELALQHEQEWGWRPWAGSCSVAFPIVPETSAPSWFCGAVLHAVAGAVPPIAGGAALPTDFAEFDEAATRIIAVCARDLLAYVAPNPVRASKRWFDLRGDSMLGAFALSIEALKRDVSVARNVVVSASVSWEGSRLVLRGVRNCDRKRRLLEIELPGCDFFFVPAVGEQILPSSSISLHQLNEGPIELLWEAVLPPRSSPDVDAVSRLLRQAEVPYSAQEYGAARPLYEDALRRGATGRHRFLALLRLGAIALHAGATTEAGSRFAEADTVQSDEISTQDKAELHYFAAEHYIDSFRPSEANAMLRGSIESWRKKLEPVGESLDRRMTMVGLLGAKRLLLLLEGRPEEALKAQQELIRWAPSSEHARALGDMAEVLRRCAHIEAADDAIERAFAGLPNMLIASYRESTEAFLHYHRARLRLHSGREVPDRDALNRLLSRLPTRSAAHWRLRQMSLLLQVRDGDLRAAEALEEQLTNEQSSFRRWYEALGLVRAAREPWAPAVRFRRSAANALGAIAAIVQGHPVLARAAERFCAAVQGDSVDLEAEDALVRYAAY